MSVTCQEFNVRLNSAILLLKVVSSPSNKVNARMAGSAFKIFIRASAINVLRSSTSVYEFSETQLDEGILQVAQYYSPALIAH